VPCAVILVLRFLSSCNFRLQQRQPCANQRAEFKSCNLIGWHGSRSRNRMLQGTWKNAVPSLVPRPSNARAHFPCPSITEAWKCRVGLGTRLSRPSHDAVQYGKRLASFPGPRLGKRSDIFHVSLHQTLPFDN